jgi:hypothetical protein
VRAGWNREGLEHRSASNILLMTIFRSNLHVFLSYLECIFSICEKYISFPLTIVSLVFIDMQPVKTDNAW